jgi:two-component sensor histidine kinase
MSVFCILVAGQTYHTARRLKYLGPGLWFVGFILITQGLLGIALRDFIPEVFSVFLANGCLYFGIVLHTQGVWRLIGHPMGPSFGYICAGLATVSHGLLFVYSNSPQARSILFAGVFIVVNLVSAIGLIFLAPTGVRRAARVSAIFYLLIVALYVYRLISVLVLPDSNWMNSGLPEAMYLLGSMILYAGLVFAELQLVNGFLLAEREAVAKDRALLLREMNHRTKNNLQLTEALVELEAQRFTDPTIKSSMAAIAGRVHSIGLLHEHLSKFDEGGKDIRLDEYISAIVEALVLGRVDVQVDLALQPLRVPLSMALPLGLVLNELVTNCLKYAINTEAKNHWRVTLAIQSTYLILEVADSGPGLPAVHGNGLGHLIITSLVQQLHGSLEYLNDQGALVRIRVALPEVVDPRLGL